MALVRAKTTFVTSISGFNAVVQTTDFYEDDDPLVLNRPDMFEPLVATARTDEPPAVEQATAAPGEQRTGKIRK